MSAETGKFRAYRDKLETLAGSFRKSENRRAVYELSLMEKSHFIEINGILHHYFDSGMGSGADTVVLIHGWDCWWMWWHHVVRSLSNAGLRVIAYDLKGHGWSDNDPAADYCIESFADDFEVLVRKLGLEAFHVAAFSFGPLIALHYALRFPHKVRSMVFFNFGYLPNDQLTEVFAPVIINFTFNNLLRKVNWWLPVYMFARLVLSRNTVLSNDILIGYESLALAAPEAISQTTREITSRSVTDNLSMLVSLLSMPVLFAAGEGDPVMTCGNTAKLAAVCPQGRFVCVPGCGHLITLELPETASELVLEQVHASQSAV